MATATRATNAAGPTIAARWQALRALTAASEDRDAVVLLPVTRGRRMLCTVTRVHNGPLKFVVEQQLANGNKEFIMAARQRKMCPPGNYVISTDYEELHRSGQTFIGRMSSTFTGTHFTVLDSGGSFRHPRHLPDIVRPEAELASIKYTNRAYFSADSGSIFAIVPTIPNPGGIYGPRQVCVVLPRLDDEGNIGTIPTTSKHDKLITLWTDNPANQKIAVLRNKQPAWDPVRRSYVLDFFGRVTVASIKNFQMLDVNGDIVMQFGRRGRDDFILDFAYPLCALQAFGIALSSMGFKMARD